MSKTMPQLPLATTLLHADVVPISQLGVAKRTTIGALLEAVGAVNVKTLGALGDDETDDTEAFEEAISMAAATGGTIFVPKGTYRVDRLTLPSDIVMAGEGRGLAVIKAKDNAGLSHVIQVPNTSENILIQDLTLDGNRGNLGAAGVGTNYVIGIGGPHVTLDNVEIRHSEGMGAFVGDNDVDATNVTFRNPWIHHNGGTTTADPLIGFGVGILTGGTILPTDLTIVGGIIEYNYNTVTKPNDSCGVNLTVGKGCSVCFVKFRNNYNVTGGQLAVSAGGDGSGYIDAVLIGNKVYRTGHFGEGADEDRTFGIEIRGRGVNVIGNLIDGYVNCAIVLTGAAGQATISDNTILGGVLLAPSGGPTAVTLYGIGTDPVSNVTIAGNNAPTVTTGVELNTLNQNIFIGGGNNFSGATTPFTVFGGTTNNLHASVIIKDNILSSSFGRPGEHRTATTGAPVSLTTITPVTIISIELPKGVWSIQGGVKFNKAAATRINATHVSLSLTNNVLNANAGHSEQNIYGSPGMDQGGVTGVLTANTPAKRFTLLATTTIYLVASAQFDTSTLTADGSIIAIEANRIN